MLKKNTYYTDIFLVFRIQIFKPREYIMIVLMHLLYNFFNCYLCSGPRTLKYCTVYYTTDWDRLYDGMLLFRLIKSRSVTVLSPWVVCFFFTGSSVHYEPWFLFIWFSARLPSTTPSHLVCSRPRPFCPLRSTDNNFWDFWFTHPWHVSQPSQSSWFYYPYKCIFMLSLLHITFLIHRLGQLFCGVLFFRNYPEFQYHSLLVSTSLWPGKD